MGLSQIMHLWWIVIAFSFFLEDKAFFFSTILIVFHSIEGKAERSFRHFTLTLFLNFIKFIFKIGYYLFKKEGISINLIFIYGTVKRFLIWFPVFNNFYKENYPGPGFIGHYDAVYGRFFNGHGPIP